MNPSEEKYEMFCAFCGKPSKFDRLSLYEARTDGSELFKEKFCTECGEPLIAFCPQCETRFPIKDNLAKHLPLKPNPAFWDPTPSKLDSHTPIVETKFRNYWNFASELTVAKFRSSQHEFLIKLPAMIIALQDFLGALDDLHTHPSLEQPLKKEFRKIRDDIGDTLKEANKIKEGVIIHEETINGEKMQTVSEKLENKLKNKGFSFCDWGDKFNQYIANVKQIRADEITREKTTLKPGFDKIHNHILYNPSFYPLICPRCQLQMYNLQNNVFVFGEPEEIYPNAHNLSELVLQKRVSEAGSITLHLNVSITLQKANQNVLNGKLTLLLENGQNTVIGREIIRDITYEGGFAEDLLFDESDPLAMVSRSQLTLNNSGNSIYAIAQEYDERRVGTYLNSLEQDIRLAENTTIQFAKGDKILIPLTKEQNNSNIIEIEFM